MSDLEHLQAVHVLVQVDDHPPAELRCLVTDRALPGLPQLAAGLRELADDLDAHTERLREAS